MLFQNLNNCPTNISDLLWQLTIKAVNDARSKKQTLQQEPRGRFSVQLLRTENRHVPDWLTQIYLWLLMESWLSSKHRCVHGAAPAIPTGLRECLMGDLTQQKTVSAWIACILLNKNLILNILIELVQVTSHPNEHNNNGRNNVIMMSKWRHDVVWVS